MFVLASPWLLPQIDLPLYSTTCPRTSLNSTLDYLPWRRQYRCQRQSSKLCGNMSTTCMYVTAHRTAKAREPPLPTITVDYGGKRPTKDPQLKSVKENDPAEPQSTALCKIKTIEYASMLFILSRNLQRKTIIMSIPPLNLRCPRQFEQ